MPTDQEPETRFFDTKTGKEIFDETIESLVRSGRNQHTVAAICMNCSRSRAMGNGSYKDRMFYRGKKWCKINERMVSIDEYCNSFELSRKRIRK